MPMKSPLYEIQLNLGAKFTEFAGFEMPIQYSSIKEEHMAVRKSVGLFDVSHMSNVWISGKDSAKLLSLTTVEDATKITKNKSQYTAILRENGNVIDDTIFMNLGKKYMIIPNAGMSSIVTNWLNEKAVENKLDAKAEDVSHEYVILAIQGPKSKETLQKLTKTDLNEVKFFNCKYIKIDDTECIISHTGYTGELGFELQINPVNKAELIFNKILDVGKKFNIRPIGLGARDTLRLEKGFILAGNEFEGGRTPLEAGMSWAINWDHDFIGKDVLTKQKEEGKYERMTYLECIEKGVPRHGCELHKDGEKVGMITSGSISPCLNTGIAMGYVKPKFRESDSILEIIIRGKTVKAKIIKPPFVKKDWLEKNK